MLYGRELKIIFNDSLRIVLTGFSIGTKFVIELRDYPLPLIEREVLKMSEQTQNLLNIHATKRCFRDLATGDTFDFVNMSKPMMNSFYRRCVKISVRKYQAITEPKTVYCVGSINARVYHVAEVNDGN